MSDLTQYIDKDLMIAAARNMRDRSEEIDTTRVEMYNPMTYVSAFGGPGGVVDYPTRYTTAGVIGSGFLWWDGPTFMEGGVTFEGGSDAPWADELYNKWDNSILSRGSEAFAIQEELSTLKRCIMQYLEDTGQVDLENAGLLEDAGGE